MKKALLTVAGATVLVTILATPASAYTIVVAGQQVRICVDLQTVCILGDD